MKLQIVTSIIIMAIVLFISVVLAKYGAKPVCPVPPKPKPLPDLVCDLDSVDHVLWRMYHTIDTIDTTAYLQLPRLRQKVHDDSVIYKFERVIK